MLKSQIFLKLICIITMLLLQSCNRCNSDCPAFENFVFVVVDETGLDLISNGHLSISQLRINKGNLDGVIVPVKNHSAGFIYFDLTFDSQESYFLTVDNRRTIEITVNMIKRDSECCGEIPEISSALANNNQMNYVGAWVVIVNNFFD
jgi:hypothetical protein